MAIIRRIRVKDSAPCHKPDATEIVILGSGLSLDLAHESEYEDVPERIIIGVNASCNLVPCDYVASIDEIAMTHFHNQVTRKEGQYYITGAIRHNHIAKFGVPFFLLDDIVDYPYAGSASIALALAFRLYYQLGDIRKVTYIGLDSCYAVNPLQKIGPGWVYAHRLKPYLIDRQKQMVAPAPKSKLDLRFTGNRNYQVQLKAIYPIIKDREFANHLICRSFFNLRKLNPNAYESNWLYAKTDQHDRTDGEPAPTPKPAKAKPQTTIYNSEAGLPLPPEKANAERIWILGAGPSLDLMRPNPAELTDKDIVITINGALPLYKGKSTYQVATDAVSVTGYGPKSPTEWPVWIVPPESKRAVETNPYCVWRVISDLIPTPGPRLTSGSCAFFLALMLFLQESLKIKKVIVCGLDFCLLRAKSNTLKRYSYANCLTDVLLPIGESVLDRFRIVPSGFYQEPFRVSFAENPSYRQQAARIGKLLAEEPAFAKVVESRSFVDFRKLSPRGHDYGWKQAAQLPKGAELGHIIR